MSGLKFMGWSYEQWQEAAKEAGEECSADWFVLLMSIPFAPGSMDATSKAIDIHCKWMQRHAYDPGLSPIVIADVGKPRGEKRASL